jgi:hypothetical protein
MTEPLDTPYPILIPPSEGMSLETLAILYAAMVVVALVLLLLFWQESR